MARQLTLNALNAMLLEDIGVPLSRDMFFKLSKTMYEDKEHILYGRFGVYSIFKNCSRREPPFIANTRDEEAHVMCPLLTHIKLSAPAMTGTADRRLV